VALHRFSTPKWTKTVLDNDEMEFKVKITKPNPRFLLAAGLLVLGCITSNVSVP
jgi:hypothetical protein